MPGLRPISFPVALCVATACDYTEPDSAANAAPPAPTANDINIVVGAQNRGDEAFSPNPRTVALNGESSVTIRWVNTDISGGDYVDGTAVVHAVVSDSDPAAFEPSGDLAGNATHSIELTAPGDYPYHCSLHPAEVGTIHVDP
jgi:plastocyanin